MMMKPSDDCTPVTVVMSCCSQTMPENSARTMVPMRRMGRIVCDRASSLKVRCSTRGKASEKGGRREPRKGAGAPPFLPPAVARSDSASDAVPASPAAATRAASAAQITECA